MPATNQPPPPSLFAFSSLSAQGPPLTVDWILSLMVFLPFTSKADTPGTRMLFAWRQWEFCEVSSRARVRQGIWKKEEMTADYECCGMVWQRLQALSDAVNCRSTNKSPRTSCVFILPDSRTTMQKHKSLCQTIMGPKKQATLYADDVSP